MKVIVRIAVSFVFFLACNNAPRDRKTAPLKPEKENESFFPVTDYIKGQIFEITAKGVTSVRYITIHDHTDSGWLNHEDLYEAFKEFLHPEIDSINMKELFTESKFLDQTINAFTFTYDAKGKLPDSMTLKHWDVYIDPETGKVKRIYMVKNLGINKTLQLTWLGNKSCKSVTIIDSVNGNSSIEKEINITWDF